MSEPTELNAAHAAKEVNLERLLELPSVRGAGIGYRVRRGKRTSDLAVQVFVDRKIDEDKVQLGALVPKEIDGPNGPVRTDVVELYDVHAQQDTTRYRPVPGGCSIGPEASVSAGTLGGWACDETDDSIVLLTNNHVISALDNMPVLRQVVQPGRLDGGTLPADVIGSLKRHIQLNTVPNGPGAAPPVSPVDAAIGTIEVDRTDNITQLNVPAIYELGSPMLEMSVQKRGRTTRLTTNGIVTSIGVTLNVTYAGGTRLGRIQNSFIISSTDGNIFSTNGDSGSLILDQAQGELNGTFPVVGLLYAGGTMNGGPVTIANDINSVFGALNLSTVCNCVARAVIRAIFGSSRVDGASSERAVRSKEKQMRQFRARLLESGKFGAIANSVITKEAARVGQVLNEDDEAFGLLTRALEHWVMMPTNLDVVEAKFDEETIELLRKFSRRVVRNNRKLAPQFAAVELVLAAIKGRTVRQVLRSADFDLDPVEKEPTKRKGKGKKG